jgi:PAS domain S-box-containing protein
MAEQPSHPDPRAGPAARWNLLLEQLTDYAIVFLDAEGRVADWNAGADRLLGYTAAETLGKSLDFIFTPEERAAGVPAQELRQAADTGRAGDDRWHQRKDGSRFWCSGVMTGLRGPDGDLTGFVKVFRDRTESRRAGEARAEAERQRDFAHAVLQFAPWAVVVTRGPEHRFALVNPAAVALGGLPPEVVLGHPLTEIVPTSGLPLRPLVDRVYRSGAVETVPELTVTLANGRSLLVRAVFAPMPGPGGRPEGVICLAVDLSERRQAEQRLRTQEEHLRELGHLLELAHALIRDMDDHIILWTRGTERMYGWTAQEAVGRVTHELLRTEFPRPLAEIHTVVRKEGHWEGELVHYRKDCTHLVVASHWALYRTSDGLPAAILEVNNDITELRKVQETLRLADQRKNDFLATLAHELRNPLGPVRNAVEVLRLRGDDDGTRQWALPLLARQVDHMARLVDDLLDVARISRGKITLRTERLDLATLVRVTAEDHRAALEGAGLSLQVSAGNEPVWTRGDATRLAQVVGNLLMNAAKFTDAGGHVAVRLEVDRPARRALLTVSDTGVGFESDLAPNLFEPFTQAPQTLDRSQGGLGLGLALVKGLIGLHGGGVLAKSAGLGRGAQFTVWLPLAED